MNLQVCPICAKCFKNNGGLDIHMQKVHSEKKHQKIERLQKMILQEEVKNKKRKDEINQQESECDACYFKSEDDDDLTNHVKSEHKSCNLCSLKFEENSDVERHMENIHKI